MKEFAFIEQISRRFASLPHHGFEGIGDDCAILPIGEGEVLVFTTDLLCEGVHFLREATSPRELGRKALAVNLSDVAAMGMHPVATLLSLSLPLDATEEWAEEFMAGYYEASEQDAAALIGGDTTRSEGGITVNVTAIGRGQASHLKRRRDAQVGDTLFVGAPLGGSARGLADILAGHLTTPHATLHRNPTPQLAEGAWLGARPEVHAMMDLSDGLASDICHLMKQSGVGAEIDLERIPLDEGASMEQAVSGGEDYKLLFSVEASQAEALMRAYQAHFGTAIYPIGRITAQKQLRWLERGEEQAIPWQGFQHY